MGVCCVACVPQVYGVCYLRRQMEWARDFNPFRVCAIALCQGLVDVAAMLGLCIGVVSILQIPSILSILVLSLQSERGYRRELRNLRMTLLLQPVYAFVDWLCLPCALSLLACVWRWPVVKKVGGAPCSVVVGRVDAHVLTWLHVPDLTGARLNGPEAP